jgi:hypothetical protein
MKPDKFLLSLLAFLALGTAVGSADTLSLRSGETLDGTFLGASVQKVDFLRVSGQSISVPIGDVKTLAFSLPQPEPAPPPRPGLVIPAGTSFRVRTAEFIDVDSSKSGMTFRGSLDDPIMSGGAVVVPRGADVVLVAAKVEQGGRIKGSDLIQLKVNAIGVRGTLMPVVSSLSETKSAGEGKKTAKKVIGGAGLGALIGGIAGGGKGAGIGALAGGAVGTTVAAATQPHLKIPAETRLDFQLMADWKVK